MGDGWLPQGPPEGGMAAGVDRVHAHRARAGRSDLPFTIGALSGPMYVGEPAWGAPRCVRGAPEKRAGFLRTYRQMGGEQRWEERRVGRERVRIGRPSWAHDT